MSNTTPRAIPLGDATITIINVGDMMVNMAEEMTAPEMPTVGPNGLNATINNCIATVELAAMVSAPAWRRRTPNRIGG